MSILFYGDPHGNFKGLIRAVEKDKPNTVLIVGDMDLEQPLQDELKSIINQTDIYWIPGNHDSDREHWYNNLFKSALADKNIDSRVVDIDGLKVAGFGGVFRAKIWHPGDQHKVTPRFKNKEDYMHTIPRHHRHLESINRELQTTIMPDNYYQLGEQKADILVLHEAPSCHKYGFIELDDLAELLEVKLIVHGHHHNSYEAKLDSGISVRGLGLAEPWLYK